MQFCRKLLAALGIVWALLFSAAEFAANMSTAFPPPPSATLTVPITVLSCPR